MRLVPALVLATVGLASCTRTGGDGAPIAYDPVKSSPAPSTAPSPSTPPPPVVDARVCEPPTSCGVWGECAFFDPLGDDRFRSLAAATKGEVYLRAQNCDPPDAGTGGCTRYCAGPGGAPPCVDAMRPELEACKDTAKPRPAPFRCEVRDGRCQRAP